jgi:hypothetical protein
LIGCNAPVASFDSGQQGPVNFHMGGELAKRPIALLPKHAQLASNVEPTAVRRNSSTSGGSV